MIIGEDILHFDKSVGRFHNIGYTIPEQSIGNINNGRLICIIILTVHIESCVYTYTIKIQHDEHHGIVLDTYIYIHICIYIYYKAIQYNMIKYNII